MRASVHGDEVSDLCPHAQGSQQIVRVLGESVIGNDAVGAFPLDVDGLHAEVVVPLLEDPITVFALNGLVCSIDLATTQHAPTRPQSREWYRTLEWRPGASHIPRTRGGFAGNTTISLVSCV